MKNRAITMSASPSESALDRSCKRKQSITSIEDNDKNLLCHDTGFPKISRSTYITFECWISGTKNIRSPVTKASVAMYGNPVRPSHKAAAGPLQAAVSTVATAQILRASGYSSAEPAALRALSDITGHYIASIGRAAAALAEASGRTEPNVIDVVLALEDHAQGGFPGASDPTRLVLCSSLLTELIEFVATVREVPFAKPLPRREADVHKRLESFEAAGEEPPLRHVPRWLPRFPLGWEQDNQILRCHGKVEAKGQEEDTGEVLTVMPANSNSGMARRRDTMPDKREKVSFSMLRKKQRQVVMVPAKGDAKCSSSVGTRHCSG